MLHAESLCRLVLQACLFSAVALVATPALAQSGEPPDIQTIIQRASATAARIERETVSWESIIELPTPGATVRTSTTQSKNGRDFTASIVQQGESHEFVRILERDGRWYVFQDGTIVKYRPYEAPLSLPTGYLFLAKSELRFIIDETLVSQAKFESQKSNVVTYRVPLPENARRQLQQSLDGIAQIKQQRPGALDPQLERRVPQMRDALNRGATIDVDADAGVVLAYGTVGNRCWVKDIRWQPSEGGDELPPELANAEDHTASLLDTAASLDDLFMIGHAGGWAPGGPTLNTDAVIANSRTGEIRRVPYPITGTLPGCFAKDRRSVFVSGVVPDEGAIGLFQVDLATGAVRRIAEKELPGITMFPTLSPDGRALAVLNKTGQEANVLDSQVCLVQIATGRVRKVGAPLDTAFLSWLPDHTGLVLVTRKYRDLNLPAENTIARMNFNGQITPIRRGAFPIVIGRQKRILLLDESDDLWRTCDFAGKNVAMVGDGLKDFGFPALSPDEKRLVMMRFDKSTGPRPYIVDLASGKATPIRVRNGLWAMPAWR
jgi:hypothetical protein